MDRVYMDPTSGCWLWTGATFQTGYGYVVNRETRIKKLAHRFSYELFVGPIPVGLFIIHACDTRPCVNPRHLSVGTHSDNMQDMWSKGRGNSKHGKETHCPKDHPYSGENLYVYRGKRACKQCRREAGRKWESKLKKAE